jgi:hypothetical protein
LFLLIIHLTSCRPATLVKPKLLAMDPLPLPLPLLGEIPPLPIAPLTYLSYYRQCVDALQGDYGPLVAAYAVGNANTPASVRDFMLNTSDLVPKVFMMMVPGPSGSPVIKTIFRPQLYRGLPGVNTAWDGQIFAFGTDLMPGNQITTVQLPADAFHLTPEVRAPDVASMTEAWTLHPQAHSLGPFDADAPNTILLRSRYLMIVPPAYVTLMLGTSLTPREAWLRLGTAICTDNRAEACKSVLDWLIAAATLLPAANGQIPQPSVLHTAPTVPVPDLALASHRWNIVVADMPQLAGATRTQEQAVMFALAAFQQANAQQAAAAQLERADAKAPKLPSSKFPATVHLLKRVTGIDDERQLPEFWKQVSNCTKADTRNVLQYEVDQAAQAPGAATTSSFTVTKEHVDIFLGQRLFTRNIDDLTQGLQLFRFTPGNAAHTRETTVRNDHYDLVQSGTSNPSLSDLQQLSNTRVFIPSSPYELTTALQHHSIALDVYLGRNHFLCTYYRDWIRLHWVPMQDRVNQFIEEYYRAFPAEAYAKFARWISLRMNAALEDLVTYGIAADLPCLDEFKRIIDYRQDSFPRLPDNYLQPGTPTRPPTSDRPLPLQSPPPVPPQPQANPDRVMNPNPIAAMSTVFNALQLKVRDCFNLLRAPKGQFGEICIAYHCTGQCFTGCGKKRSHTTLSPEDQRHITTYCGLVTAKLAARSAA